MDTANADYYTRSNLPEWAYATLRDDGSFQERYQLFLKFNPSFQSGLFSGDSLPDVAILITERRSGRRGIAILHSGDHSIHIIGAGTEFGNGGDDFAWLGQWSVEDASVLDEPSIRGRQALYIGKGDSAGGMVWWNGKQYVWTQWGD